MRCGFAAAMLVVVATPSSAHRLDEYLQGTILSIEKNRLEVQITLTPGVAVFPYLMAEIDTNADGVISQAEQLNYTDRFLRDLSFTLDGKRLAPHPVSTQFPAIDEMKQGRGEIHLDLNAPLPAGGRHRTLTFENHHEDRISAYQVNCLMPRDPDIRITSQVRNFSQSNYRLNYAEAGAGSGTTSLALWLGGLGWIGLTAMFLMKRIVRIE